MSVLSARSCWVLSICYRYLYTRNPEFGQHKNATFSNGSHTLRVYAAKPCIVCYAVYCKHISGQTSVDLKLL